jgi:hypothetical protein
MIVDWVRDKDPKFKKKIIIIIRNDTKFSIGCQENYEIKFEALLLFFLVQTKKHMTPTIAKSLAYLIVGFYK